MSLLLECNVTVPASLFELLLGACGAAEGPGSFDALCRKVEKLLGGVQVHYHRGSGPSDETSPLASRGELVEAPVMWDGRQLGSLSAFVPVESRPEAMITLRVAALLYALLSARPEAPLHSSPAGADRFAGAPTSEAAAGDDKFSTGASSAAGRLNEMVHDLRTPLTSIRAYNELLEDDHSSGMSTDQRRCTRAIEEACLRMAAMLDSVVVQP